VEAAAGVYVLSVTGTRPGGASPPAVPDVFGVSGGSIDISTNDRVQDLTLEAASVAVTVQSSSGAPLSGVGVQLVSASGGVQIYSGGGILAPRRPKGGLSSTR
jgi:hypothetical protein